MAKKSSASESIIRTLLVILISAFIVLLFFIVKSFFTVGMIQTEEEIPVERNLIISDVGNLSRTFDADIVDSVSSHDVKMNSLWNFKNGASVSEDAYVANPSVNVNAVFFEVCINGSDECIYKSPVIPVGSHLENISFDRKLQAGKYDCVLKYTLLGSDGVSSVGTMQFSLSIVVKS